MFIWGIVATIVILGLLIFVHELGHFLVAKKADIEVESFAFGYGPKIIGFRSVKKGLLITLPRGKEYTFTKFLANGREGETEYKLNILPFGGYVSMLGEEEAAHDPRSFSEKSALSRAGVIVAGVVMNIVIAAILFYIMLGGSSYKIQIPRLDVFDFNFFGAEATESVYIVGIGEDSPASKVDIDYLDKILTIDGEKVYVNSDVTRLISLKIGSSIDLEIEKEDGTIVNYELEARENPPVGQGAVGIEMISVYDVDYSGSTLSKLGSGFTHSLNVLNFTLASFGALIRTSIEENTIAPISQNVTGIVGIASTTNDVVKYGNFIDLASLAGLLSVSFAFINILPLPALDGGHLLFIIIEKIRGGKKINQTFELWYTRIGFFALVGLMFVVTIKDIGQYQIIDRIKNLFL